MKTVKIAIGPEQIEAAKGRNLIRVDRTVANPEFDFADDESALATLDALSKQLTAAREQLAAVTRYLRAAATAAYHTGEGRIEKRTIIERSGLSDTTIHSLLYGINLTPPKPDQPSATETDNHSGSDGA
jgi:hypothetical protein